MSTINKKISWQMIIMLVFLFSLPVCMQKNDVDDTGCPVIITTTLTGEGGTSEILSDVCVYDEETGGCLIYNDVAEVRIEVDILS